MNIQSSKLFRFKAGAVVRTEDGQYGHVVRFSENAFGEAIIVVLTQDGNERERHPSRLVLEDQ